MANAKCRVCKKAFFDEPLLVYENMPNCAQYFPDHRSLGDDEGIALKIHQCSGCGLVQLSNEPVPYYREVIRAAGISSEMGNFRKEQFKQFIDKYSLSDKKLIEIGCGTGEYLEILNEVHDHACGLEFSHESVAVCKAKGLNAFQGFLEDQSNMLSQGPFDAFVLLNHLEHLPDPNGTLAAICANTAADAIGIIEVPNFDMMLRESLFSEFILDHLMYFTTETLCSSLRLNGFTVLECNETWHDYIISAVVKKRQRMDLGKFSTHQDKIKKEVQAYIAQFPPNKVAIWGAGHQALSLISMSHIATKVPYVIDSAPFKQGKYTPATHIPIVAPDILCGDTIDAVIVMGAGYSDEIAGIIHTEYSDNIKVAIMRSDGLELV